MMSHHPKQGAWLSDANTSVAEIVAGLGYDFVVLDIEHGSFDLAALERFIPLLKGLGLEVLSKVLGPERAPIQQALDFGSDGVVIPHIESMAHAERVTAYGKFPPLGTRSVAGGRTMHYRGFDNEWIARQDREIKVFPMVEDAGALEDIERIAALKTVDGIFIGPSDLALTRGRGAYEQSQADFADFGRVIEAARAQGKPWILPGWTTTEKEFAVSEQAEYVLLIPQHVAVARGFSLARDEMDRLIDTLT